MKQPEEKINNRQLFIILFMIRSTVLMSFLPVLTSADALQDAWVAAVISFFPVALLLYLICRTVQGYPDMTAVDYMQNLLGRWVGKVVSAFLIFVFLHMAAAEGRIYAAVITIDFLTETPLVFVLGTVLVLGAVAAHAGIEVIGRCADLVMPVFFIILLGSLLISTPLFADGLSNLEPVLARGFGPPLRASVVPTGAAARFLVLTMLTRTLNQPRKVLRISMASFTLSTIMLIIASLVVVVVLGPHKGARTVFPLFTMIRTIQLSEFLERVEIFAIFAWAFGTFIGVSVLLYCATKGLSQLLGLRTYRPLIGPVFLFVLTNANHTWRDLFQLRTFYHPDLYGPWVLLVFLLTVGLPYAVHVLRGSRSDHVR